MAVSIADLFVTVGADISGAQAGLTQINSQLDRTVQSMNRVAPAAQNLQSSTGAIGGALTVVGGALGFVGERALDLVGSLGTAAASIATVGTAGLVAFGASSFFAAARVSELDTTLRALANANGLNVEVLNATAQGIQAMGIEAAAAREITALLVQNQLDLAKGTQLARVAQDAAVISGKNSTDTTRDLIHGIVTLNTEVIRQAGITVDIDQVERAYAKTLGISATALTTNQKQTAVLNAVLGQGARIAGAYAEAMTEPGKVLRSLPRVINDLQVAFGLRLLPEFGPLIIAAFELVKSMSLLGAEGKPLGIIFTAIGHAFATLTTPLLGAIKAFQTWLEALQPEDVQRIVSVIEDFSGVLGPLLGFILTVGAKALPVVGSLVAGFNPLAVALGIFALQSSAVRDALGSLLGRITAFLSKADFKKLGEAVKQVFAGDFGTAVQVAISFLNDLFPGIDRLGPLFQKIFAGDVAGALGDFKGLLIAALPGAEGFIDLVGRIADGLGRFAGGIGAGLLTFFTETLPPIVASVAGFAGDVGTGLLNFFNNVILPAADAAARFTGDVGAGLTTFFTTTLPPILAQIGAFATTNFDAVTAFFRDHVPPIVDALARFTADAGTGIVKFFTVDLPQMVAQAQLVLPETFANVVAFFERDQPKILAGVQAFTGLNFQPVADFFSKFDGIRAQVESLGPLFAAISNFSTALFNLNVAIQGLLVRSFGAALGAEFDLFGDAIKRFVGNVQPVQGAVDAIGGTVGTIGTKLGNVTGFIQNGATALANLTQAITDITKLPSLPEWLLNFINASGAPPLPTQPTGATAVKTAFTPGGGAGGGGPLISIGQLLISNEAEADAFLQRMAETIRAAAGRVSPPVPPGQPGLVGDVV